MNRSLRLAAVLAVVATAGLTAGQTPAPPAPQGPTFKVQVDYVEVDALVTDQQGNFIRNLTKDDFEVFEDGKPQSISAFTVVDIPVEKADKPLGAKLPVEPDVRTNTKPFDGRVYVMVIDDYHTLFGRSDRVKKAARQFIEQHFSANDLMAVIHTAGSTEWSQEFTSNKRLLLAAIDHTQGRKARSATASKTDEYYRTRDTRQQGDTLNDPDEAERGFNAHSTLSTLKQVAEWFSSVRNRRKAILFVSEGIDYDINDVFNNRSASTILDDTREVISAAAKSNVAIYGIDPRGLTNLGDEDIEIATYPDDTTLGVSNSSLLGELRLSQDSLRTLSEETGGFAVVNRNQYTGAYDRIVRDNSTYYVLAYYPPSVKPDGRFHKIEVKVKRPGLKVVSRKGYANAKVKTEKPNDKKNARNGKDAADPLPADLRDAMNSPIPVSGLGLSVFAAPFKGVAPNASVLLGTELRGRDLNLEATGGKLLISYFAIDAQGKLHPGNTDTLTLNLQPATKSRVQQTGFRMLSRMNLPPGRYQMRVGATDSGGGTVGSVVYDLEVPDFTKGSLAMSGLVVTSASAASMPTPKQDEELKRVLPAAPVALRELPRGDQLVLFTEVYDNDGANLHKVDILTTVVDDTGRVVFKTEEERSSTDLGGKRGGYGYTASVQTKDLAPGLYVLKVEARSRLGKSEPVSRELQFRVIGG